MSQTMSQNLGQFMRLEQKLTPQLIQSMDILQLNVMSLENRIAEELDKNVALELVDHGRDGKSPGEDGHVKESRSDDATESFSRLASFDREYEHDIFDRPFRAARVAVGDRDAKMDAMANTASRPESLYDHLLSQWAVVDLDDETRRAGQWIMLNLDDDGYLRTRLDEMAKRADPPFDLETLERALYLVQRLDPVGVAAREYQECLLIQLEALPGDNQIERTLIQHHLMDVVKNRFPAIAKATGYSIGEITEAVKVISSELHLHPALVEFERASEPIFPDVIVDFSEEGAGLVVRLARGNSPELRVSRKYIDMIRDHDNGKDVRTFVRKHMENAKSLIEALKFRKQRLLEVAEIVAERQKEFFEIGPEGLKALRMSDLAETLECDPSTISRTVAGKYVQTPRGIYPMRYFFTGGPETSDGQATSWDMVKNRVKEIIDREDRSNPLNDDQVAAILAKENLDISRRTVAKYRQQLDIPSARQRRIFA